MCLAISKSSNPENVCPHFPPASTPAFHTTPNQALRHPWVLDGRLYCGSGGGSSSDGSEFSGGGGKREDDLRAPDPQDIPSELLGADSDTEEEEEEEEDRGVSREWKEGSDKGGRRPCRPGAQPPPPVVIISAPTGRQHERGGNGGTGGPATEKEVTTQPAPTVKSVESRGGQDETTALVHAHAEPDSGVRAPRDGHRTPAQEAVGGGRHASPPMPAPPPSTRAADCGVPSRLSSAGTTESTGVGEPPRSEGGASESGKGDGGDFGLDDGRLLSPRGGGRTAEAVAAEAAEEEVAAAKEAKKTAMTAAAAAVAAAVTAATQASPSVPLSPPPPLAPADAIEPFVTPRKLRSPRPLDVFSSPPLAPLGSGRALEGDSEFSLDAGQAALPPEKGRARSREGLPPSVPGHTRSRGESSSAFPLGVVERQLSMGVAGISLAEAEADKRESVAAAAPPAFHDLVKRSTRFMTSGEDESRARLGKVWHWGCLYGVG